VRRVRLVLALLLFHPWPADALGAWPDPISFSAPNAPETVRIAVEYPEAGAVFDGALPVMLSGWALPPGQARRTTEVVVVIDISESTLEAMDGETLLSPEELRGLPAPEGSILHAELQASRRLLRTLDLAYTRVAVVTFSGAPVGDTPLPPRWRETLHYSAETHVGLTDDREEVEAALDRIEEAGAQGMTNMAAGLERALAELVAGPGSVSQPDPGAHRVILFMTDGVPTLPVPGKTWRNQRAVLEQVERAAAYGIRIHSFAVGDQALRGPFSVATMAAATRGTFTPLRNPADLPDLLPVFPLTDLASVSVRNTTTNSDAVATHLRPDGTFDALVRLAPGPNAIEVQATASDGTRARHELLMERRDGDAAAVPAERPVLPDHLVKRRTALLEDDLRKRRDARHDELVEQIERERAKADQRVAQQERQLELRLEREQAKKARASSPASP
jgi:hypothetical protein